MYKNILIGFISAVESILKLWGKITCSDFKCLKGLMNLKSYLLDRHI